MNIRDTLIDVIKNCPIFNLQFPILNDKFFNLPISGLPSPSKSWSIIGYIILSEKDTPNSVI